MMTPWTETDLEFLCAQWEAHKSASVIARALGRSRNSVIGKVHRLGLARGQRVLIKPATQKAARPRGVDGALSNNIKHKPRPLPAPKRKEIPAFGAGMPFLDLPRNGCRFPVSADDAETHLFCGAPQDEGGPYCVGHCAIAYQKPIRMSEAERKRRHELGRRLGFANVRRAGGVVEPLKVGARHDEFMVTA